jgi:sigma-B regulation protein RsbU (phosphoserine phosphatase)
MRVVRSSLARKITFFALGLLTVFAGWYFLTSKQLIPVVAPTTEGWLVILTIVFGLTGIFLLRHVIQPLEAIAHEVHALRAGKPYKKITLSSIDEFQALASFFNEITTTIEKVKGDLTDKRRLSDELNFAIKVQQQLLPKKFPRIPGLDILIRTRPATEIGGDSFDVIARETDTVFYIGDATGHGSPAGILMAMVNVLIHTFAGIHATTRDIAVAVNRFLTPKTTATMFMTLILLRWEHATQKLFYTGCGHEHILLYHAESKTCKAIKTGGIALGMTPDISRLAQEKELPLEPGDAAVLFTDGITEAKNPAGEMFGVERLCRIIAEHGGKAGAEPIFDAVSREFAEFAGKDFAQLDDITLLVLKYNFKGVRKTISLSVDTTGIAAYEKPNWSW